MARVKRGVTAHKRHKRLLNAAARQNGMTYGAFVAGLRKAEIELDRKSLADVAVRDAGTFTKIVEAVRSA